MLNRRSVVEPPALKAILPVLVRQTLEYLTATIGLEARTVCEPTRRLARLKVLGFTASLPIADPIAATVHLSVDQTVVKAILQRMISEDFGADDESMCQETLNEALNIIVGNCTEPLSTLGLPVTVCPPYAQPEERLRIESLLTANSPSACPIDTNAGKALLLITPSHLGGTEAGETSSVATVEEATVNSSNVLVVDDSLISRRIIGNMLRGMGCTVAGEAADGVAAIQAYRRLRPGLVTMDVTMPKMDGLRAARQILTEWPDANIIIISSINQAKAVAAAHEDGVRHYLIKPFSEETLRQKVAEIMETCRQCHGAGSCVHTAQD